MKISVIGGAGTLGATSAFVIAQQNLADEISLIDLKENVAKSHEMDMSQAVADISDTVITSGGFDRLAGSDIVIVTVGIPESKVASRMDYLKGNLEIIASVAEQISRYAPQAVLLTATNPLDIINTMLHRYMNNDKRKVIGFSLNDTFRLRWAIARVLGVGMEDVQAMVLGEHGEDQVPLFSRVFIKGEPVELTAVQRDQAEGMIRNWFKEYQALDSGRTSGWLSSVNIARVIRAMCQETEEILPCSVIGSDGVSIGQPVRLCRAGVKEIVDLPLSQAEANQLAQVRNKIKQIVDEITVGADRK